MFDLSKLFRDFRRDCLIDFSFMDDIRRRLNEYRQKNSMNDKILPKPTSATSGNVASDSDDHLVNDSDVEETVDQTLLDWLPYFLLKLFFWLCLFTLAVYIQFGIVYCILTAFYLLWSNLSDRKKSKNPNQLSAYSVFNQNCERLPGTLTAEQFENELMHKMPM